MTPEEIKNLISSRYITFVFLDGKDYGFNIETGQWHAIGGVDRDDHDYENVMFHLITLNR